jgi:hypothetical protein
VIAGADQPDPFEAVVESSRGPRRPLLAAAIIAAFLVLSLAVARFGLQTFAVSGDEHSYRLQAEIFARGKLAMPPPPHPRIFEVDHVLLEPQLRSKYPPGWPALLAIGTWFGKPWVVNPLLTALTLAALFGAARRLYGDSAALVATALLAFSPFLIFQAASYHSHPSLLFALAVGFYCLVRGLPRGRLGWAVGLGLATGLAFLIRPMDGLLFGAALLIYLRTSPAFVLTAGAAGTGMAALLPLYQKAQFGSAWTSGYTAYDPMLRSLYGDWAVHAFGLDFLVNPVAQWGHLHWFLDLSLWLVPGTLLLALVGLARRWGQLRVTPVHRFLLVALGLEIFLVLCMSGDQGDSYGPRYLLPTLVPIALGAAAGMVRLRPWLVERGITVSPRMARGLLAAALAIGLVRAGAFLQHDYPGIQVRSGLYRAVAEAGLDHAVVIVKAPYPTRFTRNPVTFDGPVLYVANRGGLDDQAIARLFPDRRAYIGARVADGPGIDADGGWLLRPLDSPRTAPEGDPVRPR